MSANTVDEPIRIAGDNGHGENQSKGFWDRVRSDMESLDAGISQDAQPDANATTDEPTRNWARQYGRYLIVGGVVLGLGFPGIASFVNPLLPLLIILSLVFAVVQVDLQSLSGYRGRSVMIAGLMLSLLMIMPVFVAIESMEILVPYGLPLMIADGMILAVLAPPMLASASIAFLLGLDSTLALVCALVAHILCPITIAILTFYLVTPDIELNIPELAQRLVAIVGIGFAVGCALRFFKFHKAIKHTPSNQLAFDLLSVGCVALLALAMMDGISSLVILNPTFALWALGCGLLLNPILQFLGASIFMASGARISLTIGMLAGYRNTGLLIVVLAGAVDPKILIFLAIVQVPTFIMPLLSEPVLNWVRSIEKEQSDQKA